MENALITGLFLPLLGFLLILLFSNKIGRRPTEFIACSSLFLSFALFAWLFFERTNPDLINVKLFDWIPVPGLTTSFGLHLDSLSHLMTLIITGIGFLIHVYSIGYMDHDEYYGRFFGCLNFFVFAMLLLVLADSLLLLFVGWEGVGLASYLLIGFWYERPVAAQAATKAFVVNRIGDLGLLLGILLAFTLFGTSDMAAVNAKAVAEYSPGEPLMVLFTLLLFTGAVGKSAQLPLQVWLPDAMAGPTPVSALIHAATMVTAGVYLVVRMHPVFEIAPLTMNIVAVIGAATSLYAAFCAVGQTDLKRVLAYSTVSQLGFMFLACGIGAFFAAMFHLTMHAFMKACLFLAAGNVVHMMHDTTEMGRMGGLSAIFKKTHILFLIGVLAMAGIPPLAAFFSKDLILEESSLAGYQLLFCVAMLASLLTGFYLTRAYCLTFLGRTHLTNHEQETVKEAPNVMIIPVALLALLSLVGGFLGFSIGGPPAFEIFLAQSGADYGAQELNEGFHMTWEIWLSLVIAIIGVGGAFYVYSRMSDAMIESMRFLKKAFYFDEFYDVFIVSPAHWVARITGNVLEPLLFDGSVREVATSSQSVASWMQKMQSGQIRSYVAWMAIGSVFLLLFLIV